jgi:EAL domain-containing protein (putative c-di-GMP-specific phosphodiesterase class I)
MRVLAEGVETQLELDCLRDAGCENAQGYFFSPARPARELFTVMKQLGYKQSQVA